MRVLALDSSTRDGSIALLDDGRLMAERTGDAARPHAERLPNDLLTVLAEAGCSVADVDLFAVATGPGSFTGLRIGIAAMQGLSMVTGRPMAGISLLDVLGHLAAIGQPAGVRVGAWIDAYRREVFSALFAVGAAEAFAPGRLQVVDPPGVAAPDVTLRRWHSQPPVCVIGNGAVLYAGQVTALAPVVAPPPLAAAVAQLAWRQAQDQATLPPAAVHPFYVRRPDVEVAREQRRG